jgi:hypothetical protein
MIVVLPVNSISFFFPFENEVKNPSLYIEKMHLFNFTPLFQLSLFQTRKTTKVQLGLLKKTNI